MPTKPLHRALGQTKQLGCLRFRQKYWLIWLRLVHVASRCGARQTSATQGSLLRSFRFCSGHTILTWRFGLSQPSLERLSDRHIGRLGFLRRDQDRRAYPPSQSCFRRVWLLREGRNSLQVKVQRVRSPLAACRRPAGGHWRRSAAYVSKSLLSNSPFGSGPWRRFLPRLLPSRVERSAAICAERSAASFKSERSNRNALHRSKAPSVAASGRRSWATW